MRLLTLFLLTSSGLAGTLGLTQSDPKGQDPKGQAQKEHQGSPSEVAARGDGILATWLLVDNENEVALAQLAQQRAQDPEVKQFAQMMVTEHGKMSTQLQPIAAKVGFRGGQGELAGQSGQSRPKEASAMRGPDGLDHVALIQELGEQCRSSARQELESKQGAEFDRCFMGFMIGGHMKMNDMLTVFERHATGELKSVVGATQGKVESHLEQAKQIAKKLEGKSSGQTDR